MPNPVQIQVTANTAQAAQAMASFTATTAAGLNNIAVAANGARQATAGLNAQTAALLRSAIANNNIFFAYGSGRVESGVRTLTTSTRAAAQGLNALGRAATLVGFQFMPQLTSSALIGASAVKALADAAKAAGIGLASVSAILANLAVAGFITFKAKETGDALLLSADATKTLAEANDVLTASLQRLAATQRERGQLSEDDYKALLLRIQQARGMATELETSQALRALKAEVGGGNITLAEFKALREADQLATDRSLLTSDQLTINATDQVRAETMLVTLKEAIARIEERRQLTGLALERGLIDEAEQRRLELEDMRELVGLQQEEAALRDQHGGFGEQLTFQLQQLQNQFGTFSQASASFVTNGIGNAIQGVSDGIMGLIDGTKTWAQTWAGVLKSMAAQGIQFIVQQTVMFLAGKAKELLFHTSTETAKTTATVANSGARSEAVLGEASAEAVATGAKAAGSVASIPYVGWALAIAAFAGVVAMIAAASSAARADGGQVGLGNSYLVGERGPELFMPRSEGSVVDAKTTAKVLSSRAASGGGAGANVNVATIVVANLEAAMHAAMEQPKGTKIIVQTIDGRKLDLGFNT